MLNNRDINKSSFNDAKRIIKENIFYGSDANESVAASAKMNMIIAGDGHTNIKQEDSLAISAINWNVKSPDCDLILTNPPFGTSETDSLSNSDWEQFDIRSGKGQHLFLQKMVLSLKPGTGEVCTVIDEGVLNTESATPLRKWLMQQCQLKAVINLPPETFKPNKINVKSSLLYFERRALPDNDFEDVYTITVCKLDSLGYYGSGEKIRGFDLERFLGEVAKNVLDVSELSHRKGYCWEAFDIKSTEITTDDSFRFDYKYWNTETRNKIDALYNKHKKTIKDINTINTSRGRSPAAENYVDERDGFAIVIKSGSNISKEGKIITSDADWIEKSIYDEYIELANESKNNINLINKGDVLLSSTGDGTLGKAAVFDLDIRAIADGHITIIRVDKNEIDPYYLCDFLRLGFGAIQIDRLYIGSTGMIELTPAQVDSIVLDLRSGLHDQKALSNTVRNLENKYLDTLQKAEAIKAEADRTLKEI